MKKQKIILFISLMLMSCAIRIAPKVGPDRIGADEPRLPLKKFSPKISIDPYLPLRVLIAEKPDIGELSDYTVEGFSLGNGFFLDLNNNLTFNIAEYLGLDKKGKFIMSCYYGEDIDSKEPLSVFKKDGTEFEFETFHLFGSKLSFSASPTKVVINSDDKTSPIKSETILSANKLIRSVKGEVKMSISTNGKLFSIDGKMRILPSISYSEKDELTLGNIIFGRTTYDEIVAFKKLGDQDILERRFHAEMHFGEKNVKLYLIRTKDSILLYDGMTYGFYVKVVGNRVFIDSNMYLRNTWQNCEIVEN